MIMRVAAIDSYQYENCLKHGLWGVERSFLKGWNIGDLLLFKVGDEIKSLVRITDSYFEDDLLILDNGCYRYRIPFWIFQLKKAMLSAITGQCHGTIRPPISA